MLWRMISGLSIWVIVGHSIIFLFIVIVVIVDNDIQTEEIKRALYHSSRVKKWSLRRSKHVPVAWARENRQHFGIGV